MDREIFVERFLDKLEKHSKGETSNAVELADIIKNSIKKDGEVTKAIITIEELSELQKELTKSIRGEPDEVGILEEMADVYICSECEYVASNPTDSCPHCKASLPKIVDETEYEINVMP